MKVELQFKLLQRGFLTPAVAKFDFQRVSKWSVPAKDPLTMDLNPSSAYSEWLISVTVFKSIIRAISFNSFPHDVTIFSQFHLISSSETHLITIDTQQNFYFSTYEVYLTLGLFSCNIDAS